jgi:hypothetical protein
MRNFQIRLFQREVAKEKYINIQGSFSPTSFQSAIPAESVFNFVNTSKKFPGSSSVEA